MKILVVEDDFTSRLLLQEILSGYGTVTLCDNGRKAIEEVGKAVASNEQYDLVCLDIMMPEMDGQGVLQEIRKLEEKSKLAPGDVAKVVMITALEDAKSIMDAFREQADGYIRKPFEEQALLKTLRALELVA